MCQRLMSALIEGLVAYESSLQLGECEHGLYTLRIGQELPLCGVGGTLSHRYFQLLFLRHFESKREYSSFTH